MKPRVNPTAIAPAALCMLLIAFAPARADDASPWSNESRSAMRLLAGSSPDAAGALRAGIEIKLQAGWKTYWRYPGDSGVPPRFDFAGSENLLGAKVSWPAPRVFTDESGRAIGYKDNVVFPVRVTPRDPGKPVRLRLKVDYAVCEKLCIPAEGRADLTLTPGPSPHEAAIAAAEAQVPKIVPPGEAGISARRVSGGQRPQVTVDLLAPGAGKVDLLAEGPNPDWALPIPVPAQGAPAGHRYFSFDLDGLPPGVDPKGPFDLTFTAVGADRAIETTTHLD